MKSDLLFRLSKSVSDAVYPNLKALNDSRAPGSQQWKLFEYYRSLNVWSREAEKADWPLKSLADLKYRTLGWLIRSMNKLGNWPNSELHFLIGDISWAINNNVGDIIFQSIEQAKAIAWETELYRQLLILLELERQACVSILKGEHRRIRLKKLITEHQKVQNLVDEEITLFSIRADYYDPHVDELSGVRGFPIAIAQEMTSTLMTKFPNGVKGGVAMLEFKTLLIAAKIVLQDYPSAKQLADEIGTTVHQRPWLAISDEHRMLRLEWLRTGVYVLAGEKEALTKLIQGFQKGLASESPANESRRLYKLWSLFLYYERFGVENPLESGLHSLKSAWEEIMRTPPSNLHVWPIFFGAKSALDSGDFDFALVAARWLIANKRLVTEHVLSNARVMELLCYVGKAIDWDMIRGAAVSCVQFLARHPNLPQALTTVANSIAQVSKHLPHHPGEARIAVEKSIMDINAALQAEQLTAERYAKWVSLCWSNSIQD